MKKSVWLLSALSVLVCFTGCQNKGVKIGVSAPISGDIAALGQSTKNAVLLAQEEINAKGGITIGGAKQKVTFIIEDDENKPEAAATVFQKLINQDKVAAIIGSQSSKCSNAGAPIAEAAGIPQISPWSTNPNVTKDKRFVFRACFIDPFQGKAVAGFARGKMKAGTAAVLYDVASDYNKGIAEVFRNEFTKAGGKIVGFETYNTNDKDFSAQLSKIKGAAPDVLFLPNYFNDVPLQVQQARKLGMTCKFIGSDGWDNQELIKMGGKDMEGTYFSNHYSPDVDRPASKKFIASYAKKYNTQVDAAAALTYDSVYLLVNAMEKAGKLDSKAIRDALAGTKNFDGVTGVINYNGSGDPVKGAVIIRVENGKFVFDSAVN